MNKKCDWCGCELTKGRKRFCSNEHKDKYHNINNPRGYYDPNRQNPEKELNCDTYN